MYLEDFKITSLNMLNIHTLPTSTKSVPATFLLLIVVIFAGCSSDEPIQFPVPTPIPPPTATPVPPPPPTATETIALSRAAMIALDSFNFQLTHESGHTTLSGALQLTRAGGLVAINGLDIEAEANIGRAFVKVKAVVIGEQTWMTNPLTGVWSEIAAEDSPFSFLDPVKLVADILGDTQQAAYSSDSKSASAGDLIVTGTIRAQSLAALVGSVDLDAVPSVVLTLDLRNKRLKKIVISGPVQPEDESDTIRVITLSEFDEPVSLEPPI